MDLVITKGTTEDIEELSALYDTLNEYLETHVNYPGWKKGIYPIREDAEDGVKENALFVARQDGKIVGSFILRHRPEEAYKLADWKNEFSYEDIFVLYTFVVHPECMNCGLGRKLMEYIVDYSKKNKQKAIRLDVFEKNAPAIHLYKKCGFEYIDSVDLGYASYGLDKFELYQRVL